VSEAPQYDRFEAWLKTKLGAAHLQRAPEKSLRAAFMAGWGWEPLQPPPKKQVWPKSFDDALAGD